MKASEIKLLEFLKNGDKFAIPIYQRTYAWDVKQCEQFFHDILAAGKSEATKLHFVGSVVYIQDGISAVTNSSWQVIDGQQRLTTLTLMLEALARKLPEAEQIVPGFSANKIRNSYLFNPDEEGADRFKLDLTQTDDTTLKAILKRVDKMSWPSDPSINITRNFEFFSTVIADTNLEEVCRGIAKLAIVHVSLERGLDNPQLIFESMNSTGKALSQADLIRNFILMGLEEKLQAELYEYHWRPMELAFGQEAYASKFDNFIRYYLTAASGSAPKVNEVYEDFKKYAQAKFSEPNGIARLVKEVHEYSTYYCAIALGAESDDALKDAFHDLIGDLDFSVTLPTLLKLYKLHNQGLLSKEDFVRSVRLIESYLFRRFIVGIPTSSLNKTFAAIPNLLEEQSVFDSLAGQLLNMQSYKRFPEDEEFFSAIQERDLYNIANRTYWLRKLENHGTKEMVVVENLTVEHVMPQNPSLSKEWQDDLGPDWEAIHSRYLHWLGNLTLTGYNSEYSDKPFLYKRDLVVGEEKKGLRFSPLNLNQGFAELDVWDEAAIVARGSKLAQLALGVWAKNVVSEEVIKKYATKKTVIEKTDYTFDDHEYLHREETLALFENFQSEVLSLDPNVSVEVKKVYIAFKLQTNFVDVVPRASSLLLSINIDFDDVDDPLGKAKNVAELGRWGNGDVELKIESQDDIPYAIGLVRQALEKQLA